MSSLRPSRLALVSLTALMVVLACGRAEERSGGGSGGVGGATDDLSRPVKWTSPAAGSTTNGVVSLAVTVSGAPPDSVTFYAGSQLLGTVAQAPFAFNWDTRQVPEGSYQLVAHATRAGQELLSAVRVLTVDRTGPVLISVANSDLLHLDASCSVELLFSKQMSAASMASLAVTDDAGHPLPFNFAFGGNAQWFTIGAGVALPVTVHLTLDGHATDMAGNPLQGSRELTFRCSDWTPSLSEDNVYVNTGFPASMALADSPLGERYVAWVDAASFSVQVRRFDGSSWVSFGRALWASDPPGAAPVLRAGPDESLVMALNHIFSFSFYRWGGRAWSKLPALDTLLGPNRTGISAPQLAIDAAGGVYVAWTSAGIAHVRYLPKGGSAWQTLGDEPDVVAWAVNMALDAEGLPVVEALAYGSASGDVVWHWNGTAWESLEPVSGSLGRPGLDAISLASDAHGKICAAYSLDQTMVGVRCFDGAHWGDVTAPRQSYMVFNLQLAGWGDDAWAVSFNSGYGTQTQGNVWIWGGADFTDITTTLARGQGAFDLKPLAIAGSGNTLDATFGLMEGFTYKPHGQYVFHRDF